MRSDSYVLRITDTTPLAKLKMKNLTSHIKTKDELTVYLSKKLLDQGNISQTSIVVAYRDICESNFRDTANLHSNQEVADTKVILHVVETVVSRI